jgi:exopolysaccharide production protein ExoQ
MPISQPLNSNDQEMTDSLRLEKAVQIRTKPSLWLWIPYVWLFFGATRTLSTWLTGGIGSSSTMSDGSPMDRWLMSALILIGIVVLYSRSQKLKRILASNKRVVIFFVYLTLSIIWSNFPDISLRRGIRSIGTFVMVLMVLTEPSALEAVRVLLRRLYFVHIPLSVIVIKYFRNIGVVYNWSGAEEQWIGLTTDKNSLGQVAMCAGIFFFWQILQEWPRRKLTMNVPMLGLTLWILRGSKNIHSSTAILGFLACAAILLLFQVFRKRAANVKRYLLTGTVAALFIIPLLYIGFSFFNTTPLEAVIHASGRDMTFTDRDLIWADVMNNAAKSPILGVGIGAYWVGEIGYDRYPMPNWSAKTPGWRPEEGHNGFIDVYAELGIVGVILLLGVIAYGFAGIFREIETNFSFGTLRLALFLGIILNNMAETSFLKGTHGLWFLFLLVAVGVPQSMRKGYPGGQMLASQDQLDVAAHGTERETFVASDISNLHGMFVNRK